MKRLFNSYLLSTIRVVSSAYLRLLIVLPAILIPACASSNQAFCMMYSAYQLNRQSGNIQPWHSPFLIWNQSVVPCPVQTVASGGRSGGLVFPSLEEFPTVLGDPHSQRLWPMLSKSLIQFSVDGQGCVPSLLLTWNQTMVEVMKTTETSFQRSHSRTAALSAPDPAAGHSLPRLHWRLLDTHRQVWVSLLWGRCSILLGPGVNKVFFVPSKSLFPQSCRSSVIKSHSSPKSNSLGVLSPFARSLGWEICCGS